MAVGVVLEFEGATLEQYDRAMELMGMQQGGPVPDGALFHWVTETDNGIRVTDVWDDRDLFLRFAQERIGPASQQAGVDAPPKITFYEVHNYLTGG
jgi:hypothetical protein